MFYEFQECANIRKLMKKRLDFEENYFEGYYKGIADFTNNRDKQLANWFSGMFDYIDHYYPLKKGRGKKLIEFGSATGAAVSVLAGFGFDVTATDISKYAVSKASKNYKGIKFLQHDMEKPFRENNFDLAVAFDVIEHLSRPDLGIKNVYNLLRKNGVAIFTTPNDYPHISKDPTHISVKKPSEWKKILKKTGFKEIFTKQVTLLPYFYRWHPKLCFVFPFATYSPYLISPVIIIAKK